MFISFFGAYSVAQITSSTLRYTTINVTSDTTVLDSISVLPSSIELASAESLDYRIDSQGRIIWNTRPDALVTVKYRILQIDFNTNYWHKNVDSIAWENDTYQDPFTYDLGEHYDDPFNLGTLYKSGSISRGVMFGNNQSLSVNNNLNLNLSGQLTTNIKVQAAVTDNSIPIQPDGNTQQLQDFDQVYIKLYNNSFNLIAGDAWLKKPVGYFMNYNKRIQGASFTTMFGDPDALPENSDIIPTTLTIQTSAAISKGKFSRNVIQGVEGNQGPYKLKGGNNETFIIVLAGTERVFIDGQLLARGQDYDYVIDYNTAEVTFTANQLITKDKRIIVEFQYSDKNYARFLGQAALDYQSNNMQVYLNVYSETDSRNQPLQQDLDDEDIDLLGIVGDSLNNAVINSIDSVGYSTSQVLYRKLDSLGYTIYEFSVDPDSAVYQLYFSNVGPSNGNYIEEDFTALGRVYKWVAPDTIGANIIRNGDYEPVRVLSAPNKTQMMSAGIVYDFSENTQASVEVAISNTDLNTFSNLHTDDDIGYAIFTDFKSVIALQTQENPWELVTSFRGEFVDENFNMIERFRSVEFERDWNVQNSSFSQWQGIGQVGLTLQKDSIGKSDYSFNMFMLADSYSGFRHALENDLHINNTKINTIGSYLTSRTTSTNSTFLRNKSHIWYNFQFVKLGFKDDFEENFYTDATVTDSLLAASYRWYDWEVYLANPLTWGSSSFQVFYKQRTDWKSDTTALQTAHFAEQYGFRFELSNSKNHQLRGQFSYRTLTIRNNELTTQEPDNTLLSRLEYDARFFNGIITSSTFYEIGSGLELKREFVYIEVGAGQGVYTWNDYNGDSIKDLNEFEVAVYADQANYIRTFTPTNEYVKAYYNQFNQVLIIKPGVAWNREKGIKKFLAKFSDQASYKIERKTNDETPETAYNPFISEIADTTLIALSSSFRNTFYFNRSGVVAFDHTYVDLRSKTLLTSGFDSRTTTYHQFGGRWNITRQITLITEAEFGQKTTESDFLTGRNYNIEYYEVRPKLTYQPGTTFRISALGRYGEKQNNTEFGNELAIISDAGIEMRYNQVGKGSLLLNFNYINIEYNGLANTSIAFEMLEALKVGENYTWALSYQRQLGKNLQLNLNYNGRKTPENPTIHTGGVQVRAFF